MAISLYVLSTHGNIRVVLSWFRTRLKKRAEYSGMSVGGFVKDGTRMKKRRDVKADRVRDSTRSTPRPGAEGCTQRASSLLDATLRVHNGQVLSKLVKYLA